MKCETCKFFVKVNEYGGRCYRYPPTVNFSQVVTLSGEIRENWDNSRPWMGDSDWCGEYKWCSEEFKPGQSSVEPPKLG